MAKSEWTLVKNLNGTSDSKPKNGYKTWENYWEKETHKKFADCSCKDCKNKAEVGAHVKKVNAYPGMFINDNHWYIIPLCRACNCKSSKDEFEVRSSDLCPENAESQFGI